jgi:hypothetical protein
MESCVFFLQHIVIMHLIAIHPLPILDIVVLFIHNKSGAGIVLRVHFITILMVVFQWLSNVFAQWSAGTGVHCHMSSATTTLSI